MPSVLIAGLPGTGKGILSSILSCSPDLDVTFASYPNKGDFNPADYDHVIVTIRQFNRQIRSFRRKFAMRLTKAEVVERNKAGVRQLDDIAINHGVIVWDYRCTVEWSISEIVHWWAGMLDVAEWDYTGPEIYDGDAEPPPGMPERTEAIGWSDG